MHIRKGNIRDWPFIYELSKKVIPNSISPWRLQSMEDTIKYRDKTLKGLWSWIQQTGSIVFIAEKIEGNDSLKLGYLILYPEAIEELTGLGQAWIMDIAVLKSYRNYGAATALLEAAEKYCLNERIDYLGLAVSSHNLNALRLYEKLGFAEERKLMVKVLQKAD
jgi:ribosomal protein S18 acetylase RimI-like enzyme